MLRVLAALLAAALAADSTRAAEATPLILETRIPLGAVSGRIDHLAFDPKRNRLYVAELANNSVGIVDAKTRRLIRTVPGLEEPQGIGYEPTTDTIYVANGGDGSVRVFSGSDFALLDTIALGKDADNVRIDAATHRVYVGYGDGALAVIDPMTRKRIADISLYGHPEGFQLDPGGDVIFVNVPDATHIAVISRKSARQVAAWTTGTFRSNYPLALDPAGGRIIAVFRRPAHLQSFEIRTGRQLSGIGICADSDDLFADAKRKRVYIICGQGYVDVLDSSGDRYAVAGRFASSEGSRTGLFVAELDRLFVAIRATQAEAAALWVLRPNE